MKFLLLVPLFLISTITYAKYINYDDDIALKALNENTGVFNSDHFISNDKSRFSLLYHVNGSLFQSFEISTIEVNYGQKLDIAWLEFFAAQTVGKQSQFIGTSAYAEEENDTYLYGGLGLSYRMSYIQYLFNMKDIFETTSAYLTYGSYAQKTTSYSYTGPGLKTDYGIHYRTSSTMHYGLKFSYNLAMLTRPQEELVLSTGTRTLSPSWFTVALDLSFYFN